MKKDTQFVDLPLNDSLYESSVEKYFKETWEFGPFETFSSIVFGREQTENDNIVTKDLLHRFENHALNIEAINNKKLLFGVCLAFNMNDLAMAFADKSHMSSNEIAYFALRQKNDKFLSLLLEKASLDPTWTPKKFGETWLFTATLSSLESLRLIFKHFDVSTLRWLASHHNSRLLEVVVSRDTKDLPAILDLFLSIGVNFNVADHGGKYPTQHHASNQIDPERQAIFTQYGIINTKSLQCAIATRDLTAIQMCLKHVSPKSLDFVFVPTSDEKHRLNEPFHLKNDEIIHGGYKWSPRVSFFNYAVYCGDAEIIKLLVDNILMPSFTPERTVKILAESLDYLQQSTHKATKNDPARLPKMEIIEKFLQARLTEAQFKLSPKSSMRFYQPAKPEPEMSQNQDYDNWKAPTYS